MTATTFTSSTLPCHPWNIKNFNRLINLDRIQHNNPVSLTLLVMKMFDILPFSSLQREQLFFTILKTIKFKILTSHFLFIHMPRCCHPNHFLDSPTDFKSMQAHLVEESVKTVSNSLTETAAGQRCSVTHRTRTTRFLSIGHL